MHRHQKIESMEVNMDNRAVAKNIAGEAIVLLKNNEHLLPFSKGQKAAFFGRAQIDL